MSWRSLCITIKKDDDLINITYFDNHSRLDRALFLLKEMFVNYEDGPKTFRSVIQEILKCNISYGIDTDISEIEKNIIKYDLLVGSAEETLAMDVRKKSNPIGMLYFGDIYTDYDASIVIDLNDDSIEFEDFFDYLWFDYDEYDDYILNLRKERNRKIIEEDNAKMDTIQNLIKFIDDNKGNLSSSVIVDNDCYSVVEF